MITLKENSTVSFSLALRKIKNGARMAREGWNNPGMWVEAEYPTEISGLSFPYLVIQVCETRRLPWQPAQVDLFENDWFELHG